MTALDFGTMDERDAVAALIAAEWKYKAAALFDARRALEDAGAVDDRRADCVSQLDRARVLLNDAQRAHENATRLEATLKGLLLETRGAKP